MRPVRAKIEANAEYADRYGRRKKKSLHRKLRRKRTIARNIAHLEALGVDWKAVQEETEAPVA